MSRPSLSPRTRTAGCVASLALLISGAHGQTRDSAPATGTPTPAAHTAPPAAHLPAWIEARFRFRVPTPARSSELAAAGTPALGVGLALSDADAGDPPDALAWDEPTIPGNAGLCLALDIFNPPPTQTEPRNDPDTGEPRPPLGWFDGFGNWYDRPQRELSVHALGREQLNMRIGHEFRAGEWIDARAVVRFETGRAVVSLWLDEQTALTEAAIPGVRAFRPNAAVGVACAGCEVGPVELTLGPAITPPPEPVTVRVFDRQLVHAEDQRPTATADFSAVPERVGRIVARLALDEPEVGFDHWDKRAALWLWETGATDDAEPRRFEVLRFITPFRRGWVWHADVTHLAPLFRDERTLGLFIETYMKGWLVSVDLDFYEADTSDTGPAPIAVVPLWSGEPEIGNPDKPVADFYAARTIDWPAGATHAAVFTTVTGHGMEPNAQNAGEFMPIDRTLRAQRGERTVEATDRLWNEEVYLNPCRPQGGTWKFDRAAWAPGSVVGPWTVDLSDLSAEPGPLTIGYTLAPYENTTRGRTWAPFHWTESVLVFFGDSETPSP